MSWINRMSRLMVVEASTQQLRSFGFIVGGVFLCIGLWPVVRYGQDLRLWPAVLGGLFALPALMAPSALRRPYRIWMLIGSVLGEVNSRIILTALFYLVFTPMSAFMRLIGRDSMGRQFEPDRKTYRVIKRSRPASHLKHQF